MSKTRKLYRWRTVAWPVFIAFGIMALIVLALALPGSPLRLYNKQLTIIGETIMIFMVLCPLVICMIIPYALLVGLIYVVQQAHNLTAKGLDQARELTHEAALKAVDVADTASEKSIGFNARFAFIYRIFESNDQDGTTKEQLEKSDIHDRDD